MLTTSARLRALPLPLRARARAGLGAKVMSMWLRGSFHRLRFGFARGPLLLGRGVRLRDAGGIRAHGRITIEDYAEIQGLSVKGIWFGERVSIGSYAMIRPSGYYSRALGEGLTVGNDSSIGPCCYIGCSGQIHIGERVMLGPGVRLFAEDHVFADSARSIKSQGVVLKPIVIEDDVWIGSGTVVTGGVRIGKGAVVGAGSVVTKDVSSDTVVAGVPARVVRER